MLSFGLKLNAFPVGSEMEGVLKHGTAFFLGKKMLDKSLQKEVKTASSDTHFTQVIQ